MTQTRQTTATKNKEKTTQWGVGIQALLPLFQYH